MESSSTSFSVDKPQAMSFRDVMGQARRLYAAKKYDEARKKADLIHDSQYYAVKEEEGVLLGKIYLKAGIYDRASYIFRICTANTEDEAINTMKEVAFRMNRRSRGGREVEAIEIRAIFEEAMEKLLNGDHFDVATAKLDLLPCEVQMLYLQGLSKFNDGELRDAKVILETCSSLLLPQYLEANFNELVRRTSEGIAKLTQDILDEGKQQTACKIEEVGQSVSRKGRKGRKGRQARKGEEAGYATKGEEVGYATKGDEGGHKAEEGPPLPRLEEQVEEPSNRVEIDLLNKSFDLYSRCIVEDIRGGMFSGFMYLGDKVNQLPFSLVDLGDAENAVHAMNIMLSIKSEFVLRGMGILQENSQYVVVEEVVTLQHWLEMKVKKFQSNSTHCENKKSAWWKFIEEDLRALSRHACRGLKSLFDQNHGCNRLGNIDEGGVYISVAENKLKLLPSTNVDRLREIRNLKDLLFSIVGYPFQLTAKDVLVSEDFGFGDELRFFHRIVSQENMSFAGYATLLDPSFTWTRYEKLLFIEKLKDLVHQEMISSSYISAAMTWLGEGHPLHDWRYLVKNGGILEEIYNEASKSSWQPYDEPFHLVWFSSNVYRHFLEKKYQHFPERHDKDKSKIKAEKLISGAFPGLHVFILEALVTYQNTSEHVWSFNTRMEAFQILLSSSPWVKEREILLEDVHG